MSRGPSGVRLIHNGIGHDEGSRVIGHSDPTPAHQYEPCSARLDPLEGVGATNDAGLMVRKAKNAHADSLNR
jgi:hypothetical protein